MVLVNSKESYEQHKSLVEQFEKELFLPSFPNEDEREPFENIVRRITGDSYPITALQLIDDGGRVDAGCVSDYYPECNAIEPIYLVVREPFRKKGLGGWLLDDLMKVYPGVKHMFLESDNPEKVSAENSAIDPTVRISIYEKLGFKKVPITYVQPPLSEDTDYERNLVLMHRGETLTKEDLKQFLYWFYKGLHYEESEELVKMYGEIECICGEVV